MKRLIAYKGSAGPEGELEPSLQVSLIALDRLPSGELEPSLQVSLIALYRLPSSGNMRAEAGRA